MGVSNNSEYIKEAIIVFTKSATEKSEIARFSNLMVLSSRRYLSPPFME